MRPPLSAGRRAARDWRLRSALGCLGAGILFASIGTGRAVTSSSRTMVGPRTDTGMLAYRQAQPDTGRRVIIVADTALRGLGSEGIAQLHSVSVDRSGRWYVLDAARGEVLAFDPSGAAIARVGGPGTVAGRFRVARSVTIDEDDTIFVLDPALRRVTSFHWVGSALQVRDTISMRAPGVSMCAMRDRLYVFGFRPDGIIHVFDRSGRLEKTFGTPFEAGEPLLQSHLVDGPIACDSNRGSITVASALLQRVRSYSVSGELLWEHRVAGVPRMQVTQSGPSVVDIRATDPNAVLISSLVVLGEGRLLVQMRRHGRDEVVRASVLDAATGTAGGAPSAAAFEVVGLHGTRALVARRLEDVTPRLARIRLAR